MMMLVLIKINHDVTLSASFTQSRKHNELEDILEILGTSRIWHFTLFLI